MKSSSLRLVKESGILNPRGYRDALIHDWYLSHYYAVHLTQYKLRCAMSKLIMENIKDGELHCKDNSYSVIWINSASVCRKADQVLLSFRYCPILERGYVLIKVLRTDDEPNWTFTMFDADDLKVLHG